MYVEPRPIIRPVMDSLSKTPKTRRPKINILQFGNVWYAQYKGETYKLDDTQGLPKLWI